MFTAFTKENKFGFKNQKGFIVIKPEYEFAFDFTEGLACVRKEGKWGYINAENKFVIKPVYYDATPFGVKDFGGKGKALVLTRKFKCVIDKSEEVYIKEKVDFAVIKKYISPEKNYVLSILRIPLLVCMPGQSSDADGLIELKEIKKNIVLKEKTVTMIANKKIPKPRWGPRSISIKGYFSWKERDFERGDVQKAPE